MSGKTMTTDELRKRLSVAVVDESAYARCLPIAEERDRLRAYVREQTACQCSDDEACRFVQERDEALAEVGRMREEAEYDRKERAEILDALGFDMVGGTTDDVLAFIDRLRSAVS